MFSLEAETSKTAGIAIKVKYHEGRYNTRNCGGVGLTMILASTDRIAMI
jgi:hypothetical protein